MLVGKTITSAYWQSTATPTSSIELELEDGTKFLIFPDGGPGLGYQITEPRKQLGV